MIGSWRVRRSGDLADEARIDTVAENLSVNVGHGV